MTARLRANTVDLTAPAVETATIKTVDVNTQEPSSLAPAGPFLTLIEASNNGPPVHEPPDLSRKKHARINRMLEYARNLEPLTTPHNGQRGPHGPVTESQTHPLLLAQEVVWEAPRLRC